MQKKNPAKRRPERLVVTLLSLLFLSTAVFATVKYVFRAPELDTDKPVVTPDGTASTDVDRTGTDEPDALGRLFGDDHAPHPLFACLLLPSYQS